MSKKDISITICTLGLINTENVMTAVEEFRPGVLSKVPLSNPSDTALSVIKGGAQRWNTINYPRLRISAFSNLYHIMPETIASLVRYMWK